MIFIRCLQTDYAVQSQIVKINHASISFFVFFFKVTMQKTSSYKFFRTWEVKQFDHAKIIACYKIDSRVRDTGTVNISFFSMPGPDSNYFIP